MTSNTSPDAVAAAPLHGVRVLAAEHMQALPYGTQLLAALGAEVIKVEPPGGEAARFGRPRVPLPDGSTVGGTFARNNLDKLSVTLDLKSPAGREVFLRLARQCDVVAENMRPGVMQRLGLGYDDIARVNPRAVYVSVSGFGNRPSPYRSAPAYAPVVEAMAGFYEPGRLGDEPLRPGTAGPLGDTAAAMFAVIGMLAALRHRTVTGLGQHVDIAMFDAMIAMNEMYVQVASLGLPAPSVAGSGMGILATFAASDGDFVLAVIREHQLERLAQLIGRPEWVDEPRFADRAAWSELVPDVVRPAVETWASNRPRGVVVAALNDAGIPAGPCNTLADLRRDEHVLGHRMLLSPGGPGLVAGNPVHLSRALPARSTGLPGLGEHTDQVLSSLLGLSAVEIAALRADGAMGEQAGQQG